MKLVLDACVALKAVLKEADSNAAIGLLDEFRNQIHELIAPDTLPIEMTHALTRAERQKVIAKGEARPLFALFLESCPALYTYGDFLDRAVDISSDMRIGVFDCLYLALAEEENCKVVTVDRRFLELFPQLTVSLSDL